MGKVRNYQLNYLLAKFPYSLEKDEQGNVISVTFSKDNNATDEEEYKVIFEDYFITGFDGFDFHKKWNNDIPPFEKIMFGKIEKETEKMYYLNVYNTSHTKQWTGWCPKKSCKIERGTIV